MTELRDDRRVGTWGPGLYSDDIAADLKATLASLLRLPLEPDEILAILRKQEPSLDNPDDESHCDCWFVVADRFHRYGITHSATVDRVTGLIDRGVDLRVKGRSGCLRQTSGAGRRCSTDSGSASSPFTLARFGGVR